MMISLRPSNVPTFLHSSRHYQNLDLNHDDEFLIPAAKAKLDKRIDSIEDFGHLYDTLEYWGSDEILPEMLHYALYKTTTKQLVETARRCRHHAKYLDAIHSVKPRNFYFHKLNAALQHGVLEVLIFLRKEGYHFNQESVLYAIRAGSIPCLRYVLSEGATDPILVHTRYWGVQRSTEFKPTSQDLAMVRHCIDSQIKDVLVVDSCAIAAALGDLQLLRQLHELHCPWDATVCTKAASNGHLPCLQYLHDNGAPWDANTSAAAAEGQFMDCLTYCIENGCPEDGRVSVFAIQHDNIEMLIYGHEEPFPPLPWEDDMCLHAALRGSLRCLRYVHEAGCALTIETCSASAQNSLECLQYARDHGAQWGPATFLRAAKNYRMDTMEYVLSNGCPTDLDVCLRAIKQGNGVRFLPLVFQYMLPLHPDMCRIAAKYGFEEELRLLHEAGCPWTVATTRDASRHGRLNTLKYAGDRGCPVEYVPCSCSVLPDHFGCMKYVFDEHDSTFDSVPAVIHNHYRCFKYAHDNGAPLTGRVIMCAAKMGRLHFLKYAFDNRACSFFKYYKRAARVCAKNGHDECLVYMATIYQLRIYDWRSRKYSFGWTDSGERRARKRVSTGKNNRQQFMQKTFGCGNYPFFKYCQRVCTAIVDKNNAFWSAVKYQLRVYKMHLRAASFQRNNPKFLSVQESGRRVYQDSNHFANQPAAPMTCEDCIYNGDTVCQCNYNWDGGFALECGKVMISGVGFNGNYHHPTESDSGHVPSLIRMSWDDADKLWLSGNNKRRT